MTGFLGDEHKLKQMIRNNGGYHKISHNQYHVHLFYLPYDPCLVMHYNDNNKFIAHSFSGKYLDCGSMQGYIKSTLEISKL